MTPQNNLTTAFMVIVTLLRVQMLLAELFTLNQSVMAEREVLSVLRYASTQYSEFKDLR